MRAKHKNQKHFPVEGMDAKYIRQEEQEYKNNLLIEALPLSDYRVRAIGCLIDFHFAREQDIGMYQDINRVLRLSYGEKKGEQKNGN